MQPQDPYTYKKPDTSLPPVQTSSTGWPVSNVPYGTLPDPRKKRTKIVLISFAVMMTLLVVTAIAASMSGSNSSSSQQGYIAGPETDVPLTDQDVAKFTMRYPSSLKLQVNDEIPEEDGWFLLLSEQDIDASPYSVSVKVTNQPLEYADGEEAVFELNPADSDPFNVQTTDVAVAGVQTKKTTAEYTQDGVTKVIAYAATQAGERYVEVQALYPKDQQDITRSFDAMIGSIKLK